MPPTLKFVPAPLFCTALLIAVCNRPNTTNSIDDVLGGVRREMKELIS